MYEFYGADVKTEYSIKAAHTMPTNNPSNPPCDKPGRLFISNCDYDGAYIALNHLIQREDKADLNQPTEAVSDNFYEFPQGKVASMQSTGYAYVPTQC